MREALTRGLAPQGGVLRLLAPADAARLACVSAPWRREVAQCWALKLAELPRHALWPEQLDSASPRSLVRRNARDATPLLQLAAACDAAFSLPAMRCMVTHLGNENRFWLPATEEESARVAAGALSGVHAATCMYVCWFDVRVNLRLPPGAWLIRWRLRVAGATVETFTLRTQAASDDEARVTVTPVPAALLRRGLPPGRGWARAWSGAADDAAAARPQPAVDAAWTPRLRAEHRPDWQHLPAAVVHVGSSGSPAGGPATVTVSLFKHSNQWVHGIAVDCVQALPLSGEASAFGPFPVLLSHADDPLRREAFAPLPVLPVPRERWAAPHWATRQV